MPNKNAQITAEYKQAIAEFQAELARLVANLKATDELVSGLDKPKGAEHGHSQRQS